MSGALFDLPTSGEAMECAANISDDNLYRYTLTRRWSRTEAAFATFIMLNPSTADGTQDDPTIRRCIGFAKAWGMGALQVLNLYAWRSTDPKALWRCADPVGPKNDSHLTAHALLAEDSGWPLVAAWGANARQPRTDDVLGLPGMSSLAALGVTKSGAPRHPLYLSSDAVLAPWPSEGSSWTTP